MFSKDLTFLQFGTIFSLGDTFMKFSHILGFFRSQDLSLFGELSSIKLFIVHCIGSILCESFVKLVDRFVSNIQYLPFWYF